MGAPPTLVPEWVVELTESAIGGAPFAVGDEVVTPDGRRVRIVGGQYWGSRGLSNHWTWQEVHADGSLGPEEHGYGWRPDPSGSPSLH